MTVEIKNLLTESKTIAIVGLSDNPERESHRVGEYLIDQGYKVIPVNPQKDMILGVQSYPDLFSIPEPVDIVDVFRKVEAVPGVINEAMNINPKAIWLQLGLTHEESAAKLSIRGIMYIQSKCIMIEHKKHFSNQ